MLARIRSKALAVCLKHRYTPTRLFAVVTWFDAGIDVSTSSVGSFKDLEASCDPCQRSGNIFYALRLDGLFKSVRTQAVNPPKAGMGLVGAAKTQSEFTFTDREGTLVGLWSPGFSSAFSVAGYHFHFLSADRHHGGHLLDVAGDGLRLRSRRSRLYGVATSAMASAAGVERHPWMPRARRFRRFHVKIYDHRRLPASHHDRLANLVWTSVDLLVRHVRRYVNKISRPGFFAQFQMIAPSHSHPTPHHVQHCL